MNYPKVRVLTKGLEGREFVVDINNLASDIRGVITVNGYSIEPRRGFELQDRAIYLPEVYDYAIVKDSTNTLCLLVIKN